MAGIDSLVNSRADMFAANPQGLQQRYAMNQDLLDLLALQKLKKDKEAAQRSLQMQMQPESGTVKDQLEGQMMQATKQELASSLAPGIQQQGQAMQAQQMQKAMAGGLPTQPAPNMANMAMGGIVGYANGGMLPQAQIPTRGAPTVDPMEAQRMADARRYMAAQTIMNSPQATPQAKAQAQAEIESIKAQAGMDEYANIMQKVDALRTGSGGMARGGIIGYAGPEGSMVGMRPIGSAYIDPATGKPIPISERFSRLLSNNPLQSGLAALAKPAHMRRLAKRFPDASEAELEAMYAEYIAGSRYRYPSERPTPTEEAPRPNDSAQYVELMQNPPGRTPESDAAGYVDLMQRGKPSTTEAAMQATRYQGTDEDLASMLGEDLAPMQRAEPAPAKDPRMSRYEDQYDRLVAEEKDKLGALIDFLLAAGASGGTNLGATLMGGGSGLQAREQRIKDEMAKTIQNIETLQLERDKMSQQESQFGRGLASEEEQAGLDRDIEQEKLGVQKTQAEAALQAAVGRGAMSQKDALDFARNVEADLREQGAYEQAYEQVRQEKGRNVDSPDGLAEVERRFQTAVYGRINQLLGGAGMAQTGGFAVSDEDLAGIGSYFPTPSPTPSAEYQSLEKPGIFSGLFD